jgi:hypothetical protein
MKGELIFGVLSPLLSLILLSCFDVRMPERMQKRDGGADAEAEALGDCSGVSCYTPDRAECADSTTIRVSSPIGYCELGECKYAHREEVCETGQCVAGVCEDNPCQGITCVQPPESECSGSDSLKVY